MKPPVPWICCQIGAREHYALARALRRHDALRLLITDVWLRPDHPLGAFSAGLQARFHAELEKADVYGPSWRSIAFELRGRFLQKPGWPVTMARNRWFQKLALARLSRLKAGKGRPILMSYSYAARELFRFARGQGWRTVLGQIDPGPREEDIVSRLHESSGHGGSWERAPGEYWSEWRDECALADRIVVNSSWSRDALIAEGVPGDKIKVVPLAYEQPAESVGFCRQYPAAFDRVRPLRVLFLGQVNLRKGMGPILEAIRLLRGEPVEFTFAGPIQIPIPADLRDAPGVRWTGPVSRGATDQFYRAADLFLFPTFSDGFGLTQLEAQAWRLPVVATEFCGDVVRDGSNGWILPEITAASISEVVRRCLRDPERLQALSDGSGLDSTFDLATVGQQWLDVVS